MMKWKVVKAPRSASADRSLECLKNDVRTQPNGNNDTNNNVGAENSDLPKEKDTNKQRDSSLLRKSSTAATECINLKSFLRLSRQHSETNLSDVGIVNTEPRRSRSEVRGISHDRLAVDYHTTPSTPFENGKTRSSSPPSKSGCWIRGRKRERESRNPLKNNNLDALGKTIVTGSNSKRTNSKTRHVDCRTIVDSCETKQKNKMAPTKPSFEVRKSKSNKRSSGEDIIEEEVIYSEITQDNAQKKLQDENKETFKNPKKVIRKKGMAPKPQIATALFKDMSGMEVNLNPSNRKQSGSPNSLNDVSQSPATCNPQRRNQTYSGRNQDKKSEKRVIQSVKINNLKNNERISMKNNNICTQSVIAVAEIHKEALPTTSDKNENDCDCNMLNNSDMRDESKLSLNKENKFICTDVETEDIPPYHIDTPDYSTLDSVNGSSFITTDDVLYSKEDIVNCNTDCDESIPDSSPIVTSDNAKSIREISLSSILRDSSNENRNSESEPKKTVRFEKLDLIEKYKKTKTEIIIDTVDEIDTSVCEKSLLKSNLDVNSNEILYSDAQSLLDDYSRPDKHFEEAQAETVCSNDMTVNVLVRNPSPTPCTKPDIQTELSPTQFVAKKSFIITVAKQEKGFKSLCAKKKHEVQPEQTKIEQQISVTFLCSGPPSEAWILPNQEECQRLRSTSVPPRAVIQSTEVVNAIPSIRGRSRERKSKDRPQCKKNQKAKKKDTVFVMPQAVIDELSQVLEKRKPSLDEIPVHP